MLIPKDALLSACLWGVYWTVGMIVFDVWQRRAKDIKPIVSLAEIVQLACIGFLVGIGMTFRSHTFHWSLVPLAVFALAGAVISGKIHKRKVRSKS